MKIILEEIYFIDIQVTVEINRWLKRKYFPNRDCARLSANTERPGTSFSVAGFVKRFDKIFFFVV